MIPLNTRYGRLVTTSFQYRINGRTKIDCVCDCGVYATFRLDQLKSGHTQSCGCLNKDICIRHGMSKSPEYKAWQSMKGRCLNPKDRGYPDYGGRGILICSRWLASSDNFLLDMGPRPSKDHSLDRRDNDGPYCKENCRWATKIEQQANRRVTPYIVYMGHRKPLSDWADRYSLPNSVLWNRIFLLSWPVHEALTTPIHKEEGLSY